METSGPPRREGSLGSLLQHWRKLRGKSQLALATDAAISSRHLCFVETGRAQPSREMVLRLARALDVPLRERNLLLLAAGFAPLFQESKIDALALAPFRRAIDAILRKQEPYPAMVLDRHWNILWTNEAAQRFSQFLLGDRASSAPRNLLRRVFDPRFVRPLIVNWEVVAESLIQRVHRERVGNVEDEETRRLLAELLDFPGVPRSWRDADAAAGLMPVVPVGYVSGERRLDFFSTITTLGTPQDITLQEIRIECFFPVDEATERAATELLG